MCLHSFPATFFSRHLNGFQLRAGKALWRFASSELDLIHNHGLWMFSDLCARLSALGHGLPLIISPHGMLEPWAMRYRQLKKRLAWWLYERKNLASSFLFHATSEQELRSIRELGFKQPIAMIPNGVTLPDSHERPTRDELTQSFPLLAGKKWLLFLSRIHPKKGLERLLSAWKHLSGSFPDWHLLIAGPDSENYQLKLNSMATQMKIQEHVSFTGMLSGIPKVCALANADLFILPSYSENFGMAVAEALSYAVPVITTRDTPWRDLTTYGCGWWINNNEQELITILGKAMQLSSEERRKMGQRGRLLIGKKYSWNLVASQMAAVYRYVLGRGPIPDCVHFDHNHLK
jgi:glycosyltransferase involved in cell wall biosynthesis